ncbi:hypothetical protein [Chitinophaga sp. CF418]|uniref:DUF6933 domain-containing protein n=1 Tax=Chitinophaga sp. CF418 TaxID=1855287 RepID=UPI00092107A5|nr:hypothetical protein [Chitinophaga sp. CF418]SHM75838.1 hypothetical protein SAMN05216311_103170 [Chitinophaga sp. CF418]
MPVIIHAVQKLLNTSRLEAVQYISEPDKGQLLHSWYARLIRTGFSGKLLIMYVHEPSLLTVICKGKTIGKTWDEFVGRLPGLLQRIGFSKDLIQAEMSLMDNYVVAKTSSKAMLGHMNDMVVMLEYQCEQYPSYESISEEELQNNMTQYLYGTRNKGARYMTSVGYWKELLAGR